MIKGQLVSEHPLNKDNEIGFVLFFILLIIAICAFFLLKPLPFQIILLFLLSIPYSIFEAIMSTRRKYVNASLSIYENGINYRDRYKEEFWSWDTIHHIESLRSLSSKVGRIALCSKEHRLVVVDDHFQRAIVFLNTVVEHLYPLRNYEQRFNQGETLQAGHLSINQMSIRSKKNDIQWTRIRHIQVNKHFNELQLDTKDNKIIRLNVSHQADAPLLMRFILTKFEESNQTELAANTNPPFESSFILESDLILKDVIFKFCIALVALVGSVYIVIDGLINLINYPDSSFLQPSSVFFTALAFIIPTIACFALVHYGKLWWERPYFRLGQGGLQYASRSINSYWCWEDFKTVTLAKVYYLSSGLRAVYRLEINDEMPINLDHDFKRFQDLGKLIQEYHARANYEHFKANFEQGDNLSFGAIRLDKFGIRINQQSYVWQDITSFDFLTITETLLVFYGQENKRLISVAVLGIPNLLILVQLLTDQLAKAKSETVTMTEE